MKLVELGQSLLDNTPDFMVTKTDDGAVLVEIVVRGARLAFILEDNIKESGWYVITDNETLTGYLKPQSFGGLKLKKPLNITIETGPKGSGYIVKAGNFHMYGDNVSSAIDSLFSHIRELYPVLSAEKRWLSDKHKARREFLNDHFKE